VLVSVSAAGQFETLGTRFARVAPRRPAASLANGLGTPAEAGRGDNLRAGSMTITWIATLRDE